MHHGPDQKKKHNRHPIIHCPTSEEVSEGVSGVSEQVDRRASGPVLQSGFLVDLAQSAVRERRAES